MSPAQPTSAFRRLCRSAGAVVPIPRASDHEVWRIDTEGGLDAMRIPRPRSTQARFANAVAARRLATAGGVPAPRVVAHDDRALRGRLLSVQEWLLGIDAESARPTFDYLLK